MAGLVIRHGSPKWWTSPDIWVASHPSTSTSTHVGNPTAGQTYDVWVEVHNTTAGDLSTPDLPWQLNAVWVIPTAGPIPISSVTSANNLNTTTLGVISGGGKLKVRCMNSWTPVFENGGHECLIAWTNATNISYPLLSDPYLDGSAGPDNNWSIAQHNLGVLAAKSSKRHLIKYAFQVCNGADEERAFVVAARQAPLEEIEALLPSVPGGRAVLDHAGKVERLGIVASADPSAAELEPAPAELTVKIPRRSCRRFTLGGLLLAGNALINVTQSRDQRVVGGLSVLAMAEESR
jgi:hypothetical protein